MTLLTSLIKSITAMNPDGDDIKEFLQHYVPQSNLLFGYHSEQNTVQI